MIVHGTDQENTKFRYVWARPKNSPTHKFHIAKRYTTFSQGMNAGRTVSVCNFGFHWFKNDEVDFHEWNSTGAQYHRCYFCIGNRKDIDEKIGTYNETLPPAVHGKLNGVAYKYVWARPGGKWQMRYHIARMYEGDFEGGGPNLKGTVQFLCSHYQERWKRSEVSIKEWNKMPNYYNRCDFCSNQLEKYEGLVYNALDSGLYEQHEFQQHTDLATLNSLKAKEEQPEQKKPDEEDIGVETINTGGADGDYPGKSEKERIASCFRSNVGTGGRENILPPYSECVKCKRRYAIDVNTYIPLDGTGILLRKYTDHANSGMLVEIFRCICDYPMHIRTSTAGAVWSKVNVGKPVIR